MNSKNHRSNYKNNDFWQWNMLENLSSSRGNRSSKLDNASCFGSSFTKSGKNPGKPGRGNKTSHGKSKIKSSQKSKMNKRENRCCSSIAAHNLNRSLLGADLDPMLLEKKVSKFLYFSYSLFSPLIN